MAKKTDVDDLSIEPDTDDPDAIDRESEDELPGTPSPPAPKTVETLIDEAPPLPPDPEPITTPPQPMRAPTLAELVDEKPLNIHECLLPGIFVTEKKALAAYVNKNEYRLNKPRRKLDVSKPVIQQCYPVFAEARRRAGHMPLTEKWYAAALILITMGVPIEDPETADTEAILDNLVPPAPK